MLPFRVHAYLAISLFGWNSPVPAAVDLSTTTHERQVTFSPHGHVLTNANVWSPDGRWIVYDVRNDPEVFSGDRIERVNVRTEKVEQLYHARDGAKCGIVTYNPAREEVVFILGPEHPTADWSYGISRRQGVLVETDHPGVAQPLDAENYAPPFAAGALRGGTHVFMFSADGTWLNFTYDDEIERQLLHESAPDHRDIAVALPHDPVHVNADHPRNHDGTAFSVVAAQIEDHPQPGSDQISRAFEEAAIGDKGYRHADGTWQKRALAFQGLVTEKNGSQHTDVFVADLPDDFTKPGAAPLSGTETQRPSPPAGVTQRRLTFTGTRAHPGLLGPRHWLRSSPDGAQIAFLMEDDAGIAQLWLISPNGGTPRQLTHEAKGVASAFTWSPDGRSITHVADGSVCLTNAATGKTYRLTTPHRGIDAPEALACVFSPDGRSIAFTKKDPATKFSQIHLVDCPHFPEQN